MNKNEGSLEIEAPVERVWKEITDFSSYSLWNPYIIKLIGEPKVGDILDVTVRPPGRKDIQFKSQVVKIEDGRSILFHGKLMNVLVNEDHLIAVEPLGSNLTRLFQSIVFKGFLVPFAGRAISDSQKGLELMNKATKDRCEEEKGVSHS